MLEAMDIGTITTMVIGTGMVGMVGGPSFPVLSDGVLVTSLPPGYTTVL